MFPDILSIADQHCLIINSRTRGNEEVLSKCPFCYEDDKPDKKRRYYLSLNTKDRVFRCWFCGESGGVLRFIALLEGVTEEEVRARFRKRKPSHPAERLTRRQLKLISNGPLTDFPAMKKRDRAYYNRTMDYIWERWNVFIKTQVQEAYFLLTLGITHGKYQEYVEEIRKLEKVIEAPLLNEVLNIYSSNKRPEWTGNIDKFVKIRPVSPESIGQARNKENALC